MKDKIREKIKPARGWSLEKVIKGLQPLMRGWTNYFRYTEVDSILKVLDGWIRRKLRKIIWIQMKLPKTRGKELMKRGVSEGMAKKTGGSRKGSWRNALTKAMHKAFPNSFFENMGLISLFQWKQKFSVVY